MPDNMIVMRNVSLLILIMACIAVYYPILFNDFLYQWDDHGMMNRYTEGGINFTNLKAIFTEYYHGQYAPANAFYYVLLYSAFGYNPMVFHLASLLIHIANVCLAYIIVICIFKQTTRIKIENASAIAFITALLWAVHPMNVESVAWVSASKVLIYAFFYLASTYVYLIFLQRKNLGFYLLTLIFFLLSFFSKEQALSFPFWMLMLYWIIGGSLKERKVWIQVAPFFLLAIAGGVVTMLSQAAVGVGVLSNEIDYPLWQRFILGCYSFFEYIVKFVIPNNLMYLYPFPMVVGEPLPTWMLFYPAITLIILATLWNYIKKIPFSAGLAFFLIHIAIVLHIIPLSRFAVIADRYIYVSSIGLSFIVAFYIVRFFASKKGTMRRTVIVCFIQE